MCSIMSYCGKDVPKKLFEECFAKTSYRGPDRSETVYFDDGAMAFHRLAIMGLTPDGMQPFALNGNLVICNGEIYGYEKFKSELEKDYEFKSGSDCEILLPLYEKYGTDMFVKLDAEFACVIYDAKKHSFIAARDPIGIRPLFYGYDLQGNIVFASEAVNLVGLVKKVFPFPPGHYYSDGKFTCYLDVAARTPYLPDGIPEACEKIREKLVTGIRKRLVADAKVGFLLSGGLDSSLVCAVAAKDVPMIIPEINADHLSVIAAQRNRLGTKRGFIAVKSNCSLQSYVPLLHPLLSFGVKSAAVCTYQAISGAGKTFETMPEIVDNVIPYIGGEEEKSEVEPLKIWGKAEGDGIVNATAPVITAQCLRVPVSDGHTAAVFVSFEKKPTKEEILSAWANYAGEPQKLGLPSAPKQFIHYFEEDNRPQPKLDRMTERGMAVCAGRLREDNLFDYKFIGFSHNTLRGAAGGAVLLAELLAAKGYFD